MLTIMIAARNAAKTIERALQSCISETEKIILVDDHCNDDTVERARSIAGKKLQVLKTPGSGGLPVARQTGLDAVQSKYAAWLDADDEWLPGRAEKLLSELENGYDVVKDNIELYDGLTGKYMRLVEVPSFVRRENIPVRLFERNYMHGDTQVGFRPEVFRKAGGYDPRVFGPESYDILLRAVAQGATFSFLSTTGYRMYAYPGSVSRNLPIIRKSCKIALAKHNLLDVRGQCLEAGYQPRVADWILVSMAIFREEYSVALAFLDQASPAEADPSVILEPDGPLPLPEGWKRGFYRGTLLLLMGGDVQKAEEELLKAEDIMPSAEGANNLGIAKHRLGKKSQARESFARASELFPGYLDAQVNSKSSTPSSITSHPFRRQAYRSEY